METKFHKMESDSKFKQQQNTSQRAYILRLEAKINNMEESARIQRQLESESTHAPNIQANHNPLPNQNNTQYANEGPAHQGTHPVPPHSVIPQDVDRLAKDVQMLRMDILSLQLGQLTQTVHQTQQQGYQHGLQPPKPAYHTHVPQAPQGFGHPPFYPRYWLPPAAPVHPLHYMHYQPHPAQYVQPSPAHPFAGVPLSRATATPNRAHSTHSAQRQPRTVRTPSQTGWTGQRSECNWRTPKVHMGPVNGHGSIAQTVLNTIPTTASATGQTESRHCLFRKISQAPASSSSFFSLTFSLPADILLHLIFSMV